MGHFIDFDVVRIKMQKSDRGTEWVRRKHKCPL